MFGKTKDRGFSPKRIEEGARTADVVNRARGVANSALGQSADRLGTPGLNKQVL